MAASDTPVRTVFLDCDDCIYQNNWATAKKITESIAAYVVSLDITQEKAYSLYKEHGTCLKGMLVEGLLDEQGAEAYLQAVHAIDYSDIAPDPPLVALLGRLARARPVFIFTASTREHAGRCLQQVGLDVDTFRGLIDTRVCKLETKHSPRSFEAAMAYADGVAPASCLLIDDSVKNIRAAKAMGWQTCLVGLYDRDSGGRIECDAADVHIASLHSFEQAWPQLFEPTAAAEQ